MCCGPPFKKVNRIITPAGAEGIMDMRHRHRKNAESTKAKDELKCFAQWQGDHHDFDRYIDQHGCDGDCEVDELFTDKCINQ